MEILYRRLSQPSQHQTWLICISNYGWKTGRWLETIVDFRRIQSDGVKSSFDWLKSYQLELTARLMQSKLLVDLTRFGTEIHIDFVHCLKWTMEIVKWFGVSRPPDRQLFPTSQHHQFVVHKQHPLLHIYLIFFLAFEQLHGHQCQPDRSQYTHKSSENEERTNQMK